MKPFKVLSIDFDYFVDVTKAEIYDMFPDPNENIGLSLNSYLWANHYAERKALLHRSDHAGERSLESVSVSYEEFKQVKKYLKSLKRGSGVKIIVTDSHSHIFPALQDLSRPIKLANLDDHSDFYGIGSKLNCGNWGNLLYDNIARELLTDSEVNWVCRPDSISLIEENELYETYAGFLSISHVKPIEVAAHIDNFFDGEVPDMIFLCRSSCWVPPHLDYKFLELVNILQGLNSPQYSMEAQVSVPRYTSKFKKQVNQHYNLIKDYIR